MQGKIRIAVILFLAARSQPIAAHDTTATLPYHLQNFVAITLLIVEWE